MANSITHASLPYPIRKARYTLEYVGLDADGDPTDPTTPDTELSLDGASFADASEEVSTITGSNGCGYITLTGAETDTALTMACVKVAGGPKATVFSLRPRNLAIVGSGTLSAGSAGGGTLGTLLAYDVTGCFIRTTGGTGGGGTGGANNQARRIITYNTSTGAFTVSPNWETTPSTDTTYDVLLPEGVTLGMLKALNPTTAGRTLVVDAAGLADANVVKVGPTGSGVTQTARDIGASVLLSSGTGTGQLSFTSGILKVDVDTIKTNPVVNAGTLTFPSGATLASTTNITAGTITTCINLTNAPTAGDLTATMKTSVTTAATAATPTAAAVTGNVSGNVVGSVGSVASGGINRAAFAADTGLQSTRSSTAQAGANGSITLDASASAVTNFYLGQIVYITGGTGVGQSRPITNYDGTTKVASVTFDWKTNPDNTSTFAILPPNLFDLHYTTLVMDAVDTRTIDMQTQIGTAGDGLTALGDTRIANLDATVSSRLASASYTAPDNASVTAIKAKTDNLPTDPADASDIAALLATITAYVDTLETQLALVKAKTDLVGTTSMLVADAISAASVSAAAANKLADHMRRRTQANVEASADGDTLSKSSLYGMVQQVQESNTTANAGSLTIYKTDGTTELGRITVATDAAAEPITGVS